MNDEAKTDALLEVKELSVSFATDEGEVQALDAVNFEVKGGQTLGLVGESG
jgi:ABC-type dipeptide/oligopeptide/nickel transport system ATPase component